MEVDIAPAADTLQVAPQVLEIPVTLSDFKLGHFTLPISCHFQGTHPLALKLYCKGSVIEPKLEFDDFETMALHNKSSIPVRFDAYNSGTFGSVRFKGCLSAQRHRAARTEQVGDVVQVQELRDGNNSLSLHIAAACMEPHSSWRSGR